jgi:hypothetical protein
MARSDMCCPRNGQQASPSMGDWLCCFILVPVGR